MIYSKSPAKIPCMFFQVTTVTCIAFWVSFVTFHGFYCEVEFSIVPATAAALLSLKERLHCVTKMSPRLT